jgi:hypothetical protein
MIPKNRLNSGIYSDHFEQHARRPPDQASKIGGAGFTNKLKPSEHFQRQMWATYIDDYVGIQSRHFIGVDKLMWLSDYPHQASTWPHSQEVVARDFKDASSEDKFKITANAARLYGFDAWYLRAKIAE